MIEESPPLSLFKAITINAVIGLLALPVMSSIWGLFLTVPPIGLWTIHKNGTQAWLMLLGMSTLAGSVCLGILYLMKKWTKVSEDYIWVRILLFGILGMFIHFLYQNWR